MKRVFLVTKLHTTNIGNQALSHEMMNLVAEAVGAENMIVDGRPVGLYNYDVKAILKSKEPQILLDKWADEVLRKYQSRNQNEVAFRGDVRKVKMVTAEGGNLKFEPIKQMLRPLKSQLNKYLLYNEVYRLRMDKIRSADILVYSGAGEVGDNNIFLRQLLEIRIAQKLGKTTSVVNQSIVVKTAAFKKLLHHVYGNCFKIVVRGEVSEKLLHEVGVSNERIIVAPDTAINSRPAISTMKKKIVGINFTPLILFDIDRIAPIIAKLKSYGNEIVFITNEPFGDRNIGDQLKDRYNIEAIETNCDYLQYASNLSSMKYLISTRLHTIILGLSASTPAIPIEGNVFKTKELLSQLNYPISVINGYHQGWEETVIREIEKMETGAYEFGQYFSEALPLIRQNVKKNISWIY